MIRKFKHKKNGAIVTETIANNYCFNNRLTLPDWLIEDSNDWEEIIEKDYEILQFYLTKCNCEIYSIKRLSDGEIFTIGDYVQYNDGSGKILIKKFKIDCGLRIITFSDCIITHPISGIDPIKKPLFKTEDGIDIFEGDYYCTILNDFSIHIKEHSKKGRDYKGILKDFSSVKKAKEYILINKPCLSFNDIIKIVPKLSIRLQTELLKYIKEM